MKRLAVLALLSALLSSCTLHEVTTDLSHHPRGLTAVGHCFSLRIDAFIYENRRRIVIEKPKRDELEVYGVISVWDGAASDPRVVRKLPAGTHLIVERVLSQEHPIAGEVLQTYGRMSGQFDNLYLDSSDLFDFDLANGPVFPIRRVLDPCD